MIQGERGYTLQVLAVMGIAIAATVGIGIGWILANVLWRLFLAWVY